MNEGANERTNEPLVSHNAKYLEVVAPEKLTITQGGLMKVFSLCLIV